MAIATSSDLTLEETLRRRPDSVWMRNGLGLFGWGQRSSADLGAGPERYRRALEIAREHDTVVFASFTFDEDSTGSSVVVPETTVAIADGGLEVLAGTTADLPTPQLETPIPVAQVAEAQEDGWSDRFQLAMNEIEAGVLEKVVLSRTLDIDFGEPVPVHTIVKNLVTAQPGSHTYLVDGLVGSSPELLVRLERNRLRSVSLAGSADRSTPGAEQTLRSDKIAAEHGYAADSVELALRRHVPDLERQRSEVATFGNIHHLATVFTGTVADGVAVVDLLEDLHPTAAVAGTPKDAAVKLIRELETHDRGRYAGPVGWVGPDGDGEFAIALRCGLVGDRQVRLFSGAGLVVGSESEDEFDETSIKLEPMINALGLS